MFRPFLIITPVPKNPIPVMTPAAILEESPRPKGENSAYLIERIPKTAEEIEINTNVLIPTG